MDFIAVFRGPRRVDEGVVSKPMDMELGVNKCSKCRSLNSVKGNEDLSPIVAQ